MTDRSRLAAQGFGFACALIALSTLGSGRAMAAEPQRAVTPHADAELSKAFAATVKSSLPTHRGSVDIDPIDPNVRHFWPYLAEPSDMTARDKS